MAAAPQKTPGAEVDMFVKIKATTQGLITGESTDSKHSKEIIAHSYSWDLLQPFDKSGSGLAAGKRQFGVFKFLMSTQTATPKLLTSAATGEVLKEVTITIRKAGKEQQEYMIWTLTNAMVAKVETGFLAPGQLLPMDMVSLVFRKIEVSYREQKPDGTLGGGISFLDDLNI